MSDRILDKIKGLLALAQSDNQAEAELAAQRASELLTKHNLSMQQVQEDRSYCKETIDTGLKRENKLDILLMTLMRRYFFVTPVTSHRDETIKLILMGTHSNVEVAIYTYAFLRVKFRALWLSHKRANNLSERSRQSFEYGLYEGLNDKLKETRTSVQQETGLVVVDDADLKKYVHQEYPNLTYTNTKFNKSDRQAMSAGYNQGKSISINKGVRTSTSKGRLN
jgi:enamine deaminase RidA (YjgF/YER057c/UK114 family)